MTSYNIQAIAEKLQELQNGGKPRAQKEDNGPKLPFWKPADLGTYYIRFLPFKDKNGQPFYGVENYASKLLIGDGHRSVAPFQFGEPDPIYDYLTKMGQSHQPLEVFKKLSQMRPKTSFYAPVLVRGEEEKGVQVWELSSARVKDIYTTLANPDYLDEDLFHPETGRDFMVTVTDSGKVWNGYNVKDIKITERKKASPILDSKKKVADLLATIPDFDAYFKARLRPTEAYQNMLDNALAGGNEAGNAPASSTGSARNESAIDESTAAAAKKIEDAFADIDFGS